MRGSSGFYYLLYICLLAIVREYGLDGWIGVCVGR